jgi:hypothetical protein
LYTKRVLSISRDGDWAAKEDAKLSKQIARQAKKTRQDAQKKQSLKTENVARYPS